jgi:hypothetical protein
MKLILPALICSLLASCGVYQVMTVSSREIPQNKLGEFVVENDSLVLTYNFNGQNGPITMMIKNKLQQPLYIDWKRSALIINEQAISYAPGKIRIEGAFGASSYHWDLPSDPVPVTTTAGRLSATAQLPSDIEFLPPQTYVTKKLMGITNQGLSNLPDSMFSKKKIPLMGGESQEMIKLANFTAATTPLAFRSYLTVMIGDTQPKPVVYQHDFYVSELVQMVNPPSSMGGDTRGDRFFVVPSAVNDSMPAGYGIVGGRAVLKSQVRSQPVTMPAKVVKH